MNRFSMVLAASVATAMLVIAIATLDAVGAGKPTADNVLQQRFADCMRSHHVAIPELSGEALDRWFDSHGAAEETVRTCKMAVAPGPGVAKVPDAGEGGVTRRQRGGTRQQLLGDVGGGGAAQTDDADACAPGRGGNRHDRVIPRKHPTAPSAAR